ncbi:MAG: mechanosensitive ion channel family protein [Thiobacillus sp.]
MTETTPLFDNLIARLIQDTHDTALLWQLGVLATSLVIAWTAMYFVRPYLRDKDNAWKAGRGGMRRIGFPLIMLGVVLIGREIVAGEVGETHLLDVAVPLLLALVCIRLLVYALRYVFKPSEAQKYWERTVAWLIWVVFAAHITGLIPFIHRGLETVSFDTGKHHFSLWLLLQATVVVVVAVLISLGVARFVEHRLMGFAAMNLSLRMAMTKAVRTVLLLLAVLIALPAVGIDLTVLSVFGGALGVGLGIGLQKIASNYISGFIILLDRSVRIGDMVTVDNKFGEVSQIKTRYTLLKAMDGTESIVPNEMLITQTVVNHSLSQPDIRISVPVQVSYETDLDQARDIMLQVAASHSRVLQGDHREAPTVLLKAFGDNGILLELGVWIGDPSEGQQNLHSDLNWELWRRFRDAGITMPYPQRVVHLVSDKPVAEAT